MDVEMADDLFHVSFGIIRQLRKDLPCHWGQHIHSYSPIIWASERGGFLSTAAYRLVLDGVKINQRLHGCGDC